MSIKSEDGKDKKKIIAELEQKAESILKYIGETKRPVFIEFCGTPKAGKTTALSSLDLFLRRNGFKVEIIRERASVCPIPKKNHMQFNVWTSMATLNNMLVLLDSPNDVVLIDRGIFDAMIWFFWMKNTGRLTEIELKNIEQFICMDRWTSLIDIVFILKVKYQTASNREFKDLLTLKTGSIMNEKTINQYNLSVEQTKEYFVDKFKYIECIDTTETGPVEAGEKITRKTLEILGSSLDEKILAIPKTSVKEILTASGFVVSEKGKQINQIIREKGKYVPRSEIEKSEDYIQLIPCGIIEHEGKILLLRRSEIDPSNRLHEKYVIWAGGHVREQDTSGPEDVLYTGIKRELAEELFIKSQYSIDGPIGFVYFQGNIKSRKHLGVVYKVRLASDEVALGLDQTEFKERRGKSVSGTFQSPEQLKDYYSGMEQWSKAILEQYYKIEAKESSYQQGFDFLLD